MKVYEKTQSGTYPIEVEITSSKVFLAKNIKEIEGPEGEKLYEFDYVEYEKDEFILDLNRRMINVQLALVELYEGGNE